jgi:hypothetical protein
MNSRSIVFRGSLFFEKRPENFLQKSIDLVRSWFDGEIVVSTWKHQKEYVEGITGYDKIIFSEDPGSGPIQHIYRQVTSHINGVKECSGNEILVTRTDMSFGEDIFKNLYKNKAKNDLLKIFNTKLIIGNMMTISPESNEEVKHFRINDWFQCGTKEDVYKMGDVIDILLNSDFSHIDCTEQVWTLAVIKKYYFPELNFKDFQKLKEFSWDYILNNLDIYNTKSSLKGINFNWINQPEFLECYITEGEYLKKYHN